MMAGYPISTTASMASSSDPTTRPDGLHAVLGERAVLRQRHGHVQGGLATHGGEQGVRMFPFDHPGYPFGGHRLDVGSIGQLGIRHDGRRIRVDQDDLIALFLERLDRLGPRVVELGGLANDDGPRADDEDGLEISSLGHPPPRPTRSPTAPGPTTPSPRGAWRRRPPDTGCRRGAPTRDPPPKSTGSPRCP